MIKAKGNGVAHATPPLENSKVFGFFQNNCFTNPAQMAGPLFVGGKIINAISEQIWHLREIYWTIDAL